MDITMINGSTVAISNNGTLMNFEFIHHTREIHHILEKLDIP